MAEKLLRYYELAKEKGGLQAQMRLALKTSIPSNKAQEVPDSPENLNKFLNAIRDILGPSAPKL